MSIIPYNYFTDELYFARIKKKDERNIEMFKNKYLNFIDNFKLEKHFLCFNNLSKVHRLWMFYELMNNSKLKNKSFVSLCKNTTNKTFYDIDLICSTHWIIVKEQNFPNAFPISW